MKFLLGLIFVAVFVAPLLFKKKKTGNAYSPGAGESDFDNAPTQNSTDDLSKRVSDKPDIETQKQGYKELVNLCLAADKREAVNEQIDKLKDYSNDDEHGSTLRYVNSTLYKMKSVFIREMDWKQEISELEHHMRTSLKANFDFDVELPDPEKYGSFASISFKNVFKEYDQVIRNHGYQLSFIDTQSDEYVILVSRIADTKRVAKAINKIGYRYLHAHSPQVN